MSDAEVLLAASGVDSLRDAIATAVLSTPAGMSAALQADDPNAYLQLLGATRTAAEQTSVMLREAVDGARRAGHSWDVVGQVLGVSRQAAQQRFGRPAGAATSAAANPAGPIRKVLTPLTAFDEMAVLEREGLQGWHVVDYGTLFHVVEASPWQWEHRRVLASYGARHHRLKQDGWQLVKTMRFPWAYYTRRLDIPAHPHAADPPT